MFRRICTLFWCSPGQPWQDCKAKKRHRRTKGTIDRASVATVLSKYRTSLSSLYCCLQTLYTDLWLLSTYCTTGPCAHEAHLVFCIPKGGVKDDRSRTTQSLSTRCHFPQTYINENFLFPYLLFQLDLRDASPHPPCTQHTAL